MILSQLCMVDQVYKMAHFIVCKKLTLDAVHVAQFYFWEVYYLHGLSLSIVSILTLSSLAIFEDTCGDCLTQNLTF